MGHNAALKLLWNPGPWEHYGARGDFTNANFTKSESTKIILVMTNKVLIERSSKILKIFWPNVRVLMGIEDFLFKEKNYL